MERWRVDGLADVVPPQAVSAGRKQDGAQNRADNTSIYRALPGTTLGATKVSGHIITSKYICFVTHPDLQYPWAG